MTPEQLDRIDLSVSEEMDSPVLLAYSRDFHTAWGIVDVLLDDKTISSFDLYLLGGTWFAKLGNRKSVSGETPALAICKAFLDLKHA